MKEVHKPSEDYSLSLINPINFQLNKFFYKNIGKKHKWVDRLTWSEEKWIIYASSKNVNSYVLKNKDDLVEIITPAGIKNFEIKDVKYI